MPAGIFDYLGLRGRLCFQLLCRTSVEGSVSKESQAHPFALLANVVHCQSNPFLALLGPAGDGPSDLCLTLTNYVLCTDWVSGPGVGANIRENTGFCKSFDADCGVFLRIILLPECCSGMRRSLGLLSAFLTRGGENAKSNIFGAIKITRTLALKRSFVTHSMFYIPRYKSCSEH